MQGKNVFPALGNHLGAPATSGDGLHVAVQGGADGQAASGSRWPGRSVAHVDQFAGGRAVGKRGPVAEKQLLPVVLAGVCGRFFSWVGGVGKGVRQFCCNSGTSGTTGPKVEGHSAMGAPEDRLSPALALNLPARARPVSHGCDGGQVWEGAAVRCRCCGLDWKHGVAAAARLSPCSPVAQPLAVVAVAAPTRISVLDTATNVIHGEIFHSSGVTTCRVLTK